MKVFLVNPPAADGVKIVREGRCMQRKGAWTAVWAPISLATIAAVLRGDGWDVKLSDCIVEEIDFNRLSELTAEYKPDLAIINAVTPSIDSDLSACKYIKLASPKTITAVIGIHPSSLPEECLKSQSALDIVVRGEPDESIRELAKSISNGSNTFNIRGLSYRDHLKIMHAEDRPPIKNLDALAFPAWELVDRSKYTLPFSDKPFLLTATSRGCPYPCVFCADAAYYGKKLRTRSPEKIVDELSFVKNAYGIDEFLFWSESFTINKNFAEAVAKEILRRGLKVSWVCNSRVDNVDFELLSLFKQSGCWMIGYGIESGSQKILDSMKKGITVAQIRNAVIDSKRAGLEVTGHCVIGYPGETEKEINDTIKLTTSLPFDFVQFYCSVPFPGSDLFKQACELGWINTRDWSKFEQNFSVLDTPQLSSVQVMKLRSKAYRKFYMRPSMVFKTLARLKSFREFKNFVRMVLDFISWI